MLWKSKQLREYFDDHCQRKLARSSSSFSFLFKILSVVATDPRSSRFITRWFYEFSFERYPREIHIFRSVGKSKIKYRIHQMFSRIFCDNKSTNFSRKPSLFIYVFLCTVNVNNMTTFIFVENICRFVNTKLVTLSSEF